MQLAVVSTSKSDRSIRVSAWPVHASAYKSLHWKNCPEKSTDCRHGIRLVYEEIFGWKFWK